MYSFISRTEEVGCIYLIDVFKTEEAEYASI